MLALLIQSIASYKEKYYHHSNSQFKYGSKAVGPVDIDIGPVDSDIGLSNQIKVIFG